MNKFRSFVSLLPSIVSETDFSLFFVIFFGAARKKVSAPRMSDTKMVPIVLDVDIITLIDAYNTKKVGKLFRFFIRNNN